MEKEKYYRAIEIARELAALRSVIETLNQRDYTTMLCFCRKWNPQQKDGKWQPCEAMDCIDDILARHTAMVLGEIQERRNKLIKEIDEL